jgi:hypothetical protein
MSEQKLPRPSGDVVDDGVRPLGADEWGITDMEESSGEPLDVRLARERPDGRDHSRDDGVTSDTLSAEEAAMHVRDETFLTGQERP